MLFEATSQVYECGKCLQTAFLDNFGSEGFERFEGDRLSTSKFPAAVWPLIRRINEINDSLLTSG